MPGPEDGSVDSTERRRAAFAERGTRTRVSNRALLSHGDMTAGKLVWLESSQELAMQTELSVAQQAQRRVGAGRPGVRLNALAAAGLIAGGAFAPGVGAQGSGKGFLFKKPVGSFAFRGGYAVANASSGGFTAAT